MERLLNPDTERGLLNRVLARNLIRRRLDGLARTARLKQGKTVELPIRRIDEPSIVYEASGKARPSTNELMRRLLEGEQ